MPTMTMFTFGYWGWGSSTKLLLKASSAVERARGFARPMFVDLRISRSVRAAGFRDSAFEKLAGSGRYIWMPELGNRAVRDRPKRGPKIVIDDPTAAGTLLDQLTASAGDKQRVIAFCACEVPGTSEKPVCHRRVVADLVLAEAKRRRLKLHVMEWPGGTATRREVQVTTKELRALASRAALKPKWPEAEIAAMPWGSRITARAGGESLTFLARAPKPRGGSLVLPQWAWGWDDWDEAYEEHVAALGLGGQQTGEEQRYARPRPRA